MGVFGGAAASVQETSNFVGEVMEKGFVAEQSGWAEDGVRWRGTAVSVMLLDVRVEHSLFIVVV